MTNLDVGAKPRWGRIPWLGRLSLFILFLLPLDTDMQDFSFHSVLSSLLLPTRRPLSLLPLYLQHGDSAINQLPQNIVLLPLRVTGMLLQGRGPEILQAVTAGSWCRTHREGGRESMPGSYASILIYCHRRDYSLAHASTTQVRWLPRHAPNDKEAIVFISSGWDRPTICMEYSSQAGTILL